MSYGNRLRPECPWRECMGIEPTQDAMRLAAVLKTVEATRPQPLPRSRKHDQHRLARNHASHDRAVRDRGKIVLDPLGWHSQEQTARCLRIERKGNVGGARGRPVRQWCQVLLVSLGATGPDAR